MGKEYKYFKSRQVAGKVKTVTVKRDAVGDLWLFFVVDEGQVPIEDELQKRSIKTGNLKSERKPVENI